MWGGGSIIHTHTDYHCCNSHTCSRLDHENHAVGGRWMEGLILQDRWVSTCSIQARMETLRRYDNPTSNKCGVLHLLKPAFQNGLYVQAELK